MSSSSGSGYGCCLDPHVIDLVGGQCQDIGS